MRYITSTMIVELTETKAWSSEVEAGGLEIRVLSGTVWLTQEGDGEDRILGPASRFETGRTGRVALQSLTPARLEVGPAREAQPPLAAAA